MSLQTNRNQLNVMLEQGNILWEKLEAEHGPSTMMMMCVIIVIEIDAIIVEVGENEFTIST